MAGIPLRTFDCRDIYVDPVKKPLRFCRFRVIANGVNGQGRTAPTLRHFRLDIQPVQLDAAGVRAVAGRQTGWGADTDNRYMEGDIPRQSKVLREMPVIKGRHPALVIPCSG